MAEQRRRSSRAKPAASKGRAKPAGTRKKTASGAKRKPSAAKTRTRKTTPKPPASEVKTLPAVIKPPETTTPASSEDAAATSRPSPQTTPPERRGGGIPFFIGALLLAAAAAIAIILIASGGNDENMSVNTGTTPTAVALTPNQSATAPAKAPPPAVPAGKPATRRAKCDPIIGSGTQNSGKSYAVTSSATDGDPADCAEAHSILLSALNGGGGTVGSWHCTTRPSGPTIASCTSAGGRKILARG